MTRRKRSRRALEALAREEGTVAAAPVDPDVVRFAARTREQQAAQRDRKREAREARQRAERHERLLTAKDAAASEVRRLRSRAGVTSTETAAADAAYRDALAELIAFETGSPPAWAAASDDDGEPVEREEPTVGDGSADGGAEPEEAG